MAAADLCASVLRSPLETVDRKEAGGVLCLPCVCLQQGPDLAGTGWMRRTRKEELEVVAAGTRAEGY